MQRNESSWYADLEKQSESLLHRFEGELNEHWDFDQNIVLAWCLRDNAIDIIMFPHYDLGNVQRVHEAQRSNA
ncbi:MAG: hypothetical protein ACI8W7_004524, partial [Gammaproteobacteria bacterium]